MAERNRLTAIVRVLSFGLAIQSVVGQDYVINAQVPIKPAAPAPMVAPFTEQEAKAKQEEWAKYLGTPVVEKNVMGMSMALIPPGEFQMGSPGAEKQRDPDERPHRVRITRPFYIGVYEVTVTEFEKVVLPRQRPFMNDDYDRKYGRFPARVSWDEARRFCELISALEEELAAGRSYRLPTEAEWEYVCRAGTTSPFYFGRHLNRQLANIRGENPIGTFTNEPYIHLLLIGGSYSPNGWGVYDMHGSMWEWCSDYYAKNYYAVSPVDDPPGPSMPDYENGRVLRGGSWTKDPKFARSANREQCPAGDRYENLGMRVVCTQGEPTP